MTPTWTILIPTLGERGRSFTALIDRLMPQVDAFAGRVKVLAFWNNGQPGLPEIRQRLVEAVDTDYLSFIDDDDMVPEDFVSSIVAALESRPDYVGFKVRYLADGHDRGEVDHSLRHGTWAEERNPYRLIRDISHINPMRSEVAKVVDFRVVERGQVEDRPWVAQIRDAGSLKTEVYLDRVMYEYRWDRRGSRWKTPDRIRQAGPLARVPVGSPHFEYLDQRPPEQLRLAVIVPTRGRPDNIRKVIAAWDATDAWSCADLILAVDGDDPESIGYQQIIWDRQEVSSYLIDQWQPMVPKLNRAAVAAAETRKYFAIGFAGDDHLPRSIGWAQHYLAALWEMRTGMVYGDDGYQGRKLSTEWAITADVVRELGGMVPAPVDHLYCDNAMMDLFGGADALRYMGDEVQIEHMHPAAGKAASDDQYEKVNSRQQYAGDRRKYEIWKNTQGPSRLGAQIEIIRRLRGEVAPVAPVRPARERTRNVRGSGPRKVERSGPSRFSAPPKSKFPFPPEFRWVVGATPDEIAFTLADFAAGVPADQEIVELGVFQGRTALIMAWGASQGNGAHVTAVDAWDLPGNTYHPPFTDPSTRETAHSNVRNLGYGGRVTLVQGFAHKVAKTWPGSEEFQIEPGKPLGLLFVDDDHSAEGVHAAFEAWVPHLADGAVIAFDDYGHPDWPGVKQAVDELVDKGQVEPVEIYHDRLAVTKLRTVPITAITSEGVQPAPVSTEPGCQHPNCILDHPHAGPAELALPAPTEVQDDLTDKTSAELREIAAGLKIHLKAGSNKSVIIAAIRDARAAQAGR